MDEVRIQSYRTNSNGGCTVKEALQKFKDKRILITGGAGCIGRNLTESLLAGDPKEVLILDDLSAAFEWNIPKDPRVFFVKGSILDDEKLDTAFSERPEYVFHLAAHFANQNSVEHPETDLLVNGLGTLKTLKRAHMVKSEKFVFASSGCSVYGSEAPLPLKEDYVSLHLDTPYQITKLLGELYCNFYHDYYGLPVVIARFFKVYGPGEVHGKYRNVIPNFIYKSLKGQSLPITGTGEETRDWTYVSDIVDGFLGCATHDEAVGDAFNLASGTETRVRYVADVINKLTNNHVKPVNLPMRTWDKIIRRRASIEKASRILGYAPKMKIEDGIERTIKWISANISQIDKNAQL